MVSIYPNSQSYDMAQMYNITDLRSKTKEVSYPPGSLMDVINCNPDFNIFYKIVKKAKYDGHLVNCQSNFTLFIPSDTYLKKKYNKDYFDTMDPGTAMDIIMFSSMNRVLDSNILTSSPSSIFPTLDRSNSMKIITVNNTTILPNNASVIHFNQPATNGIIHVINDIPFPTNYYTR